MNRTDKDKFVYFVATVDRSMVKIGISRGPLERLSQLQSWSHVPLVLLAAVPGGFFDERAIHNRYIGLHSHREWFRTSAEMLADINAISQLGELPASWKGCAETKCLLAQKGVRATQEWRDKISDLHKAAWVRKKRKHKIERMLAAQMRDTEITISRINAKLGSRLLWGDRVHPYVQHQISLIDLDRIEALLTKSSEHDLRAA